MSFPRLLESLTPTRALAGSIQMCTTEAEKSWLAASEYPGQPFGENRVGYRFEPPLRSRHRSSCRCCAGRFGSMIQASGQGRRRAGDASAPDRSQS